MFEKIVTLKHLPTKDSFVYVSNSLRFLASGTCVRLTYHKNVIGYFSINATANLEENSVGLSSLYAKALNIEDNDTVIVAEIPQLPTINRILISPVNKNDYDVLESLAEQVQGTLLNQIKVVYEGQIFVIWIGHNINVTVIVDGVHPISPGILGFLTEVHIQEKSEKQINTNSEDTKNTQDFEFNIEKLRAFSRLFNDQNDLKNDTKDNFNYHYDLVYRILPVNNLPFADNLGPYRQFFNVLVPKNQFPGLYIDKNSLTTPIIFSMKLITDDVFNNKKIYIRVLIFEDILENTNYNFKNSIFVDNLIFNVFECALGARVLLKLVEKVPFVNKLEVYTKNKFLMNVEEHFKKYLADNSDNILVLNCDVPLDIGHNTVCSIKLFPEESEFVLVDDNFVRNYKCTFYDENVSPLADKNKEVQSEIPFLASVSNYSWLIKEIVNNCKEENEFFENALVIGKPGTGKSALLRVLAKDLQSFPYFIYTHTINCKSIKGKTMDSLLKVFSTTFVHLVLHQPSVLLLDDLHILCENVKGDEVAPNTIYYNRVSELLHNFFKLLSKTNKIGVCATAESIEKINKNMYTSRGSHLYKNIYTISEFSKVDRLELMKFLLNCSDTEQVDFEDLSVKTEGFVVQDIVDFCNKIMYEGFKEESGENSVLKLSNTLCDKALQNTCVLSVQNVNLHSPGNKDFSDIGGLHDIKKILIESLLWPAKYPDVFANAPLRLQSGLLLYGPPGTGKTLLAAAAAKHCGLRLISVKGPELLSKYIGASEQAVRDVFQKAQGVRPCILFFDEFDSLAPRRGHDNTGVTDRVVNQFLTQLDGIESLTGVCVLAATSRPDLLDPALLRPGRLDKQLLCPLPDKVGRLEILTALSKNLEMDDSVNLDNIAELTEWFSGADLQSLLYTAQVSTIEGLLENDENTEVTISTITQKHFEEALAKTKPSLTRQERIKYERIYARFHSGTTTEDFKAGTKATLA